jgi:saccharopine dehydrogenase-like NADP-dependent oxidoreductase
MILNKQTNRENSMDDSAVHKPGAKILVFGAGKSATCLIDYIVKEAGRHGWLVIVADADLALAKTKVGNHMQATAVAINVQNDAARQLLVQQATIVISLLPPALHFLVAKDCVQFSKHLLTASYIDDSIRSLQPAIEEKQLLFLCEMGLDPGIDHMSAMQLIHRIQDEGGSIISFVSHCGGLIAPESDDNPWHYKISWNPRNVVMAGKAGAVYRQANAIEKMGYRDLFDAGRVVNMPGLGELSWYPNRDSLDYIPVYGLQKVETFIRTTLRYPEFCLGWKHIVELQLTDETTLYETGNMTLQDFFTQHFSHLHLTARVKELQQESDVFGRQLAWLGTGDNTTLINKGHCSAMDVLQFALEKKLVLHAADKDMIVMLHEIEYLLQGKKYSAKSHLLVKGDNNLRTAMAKTVGLPLGIAAKLLLEGKISVTGLHIPVIPAIYEPVLMELQQYGIRFHENTVMV